ncbi:hypothetical protein PWT90_09872 [Aphanocladium album]|nr:hypothetical protein PWT90_09872 [Aphanocladium album]
MSELTSSRLSDFSPLPSCFANGRPHADIGSSAPSLLSPSLSGPLTASALSQPAREDPSKPPVIGPMLNLYRNPVTMATTKTWWRKPSLSYGRHDPAGLQSVQLYPEVPLYGHRPRDCGVPLIKQRIQLRRAK